MPGANRGKIAWSTESREEFRENSIYVEQPSRGGQRGQESNQGSHSQPPHSPASQILCGFASVPEP